MHGGWSCGGLGCAELCMAVAKFFFLTRRTQCRIKHLESSVWMVFSDAAWAGGLDGRSAGGRAPFVSKELFGVAFCRILSRCGCWAGVGIGFRAALLLKTKDRICFVFVILVWVRCRSRHAGPR